MGVLTLLAAAAGLALFVEGLPWFVAPAGARRVLEQIARLNDLTLRLVGLALMTAGLVVAHAALH